MSESIPIMVVGMAFVILILFAAYSSVQQDLRTQNVSLTDPLNPPRQARTPTSFYLLILVIILLFMSVIWFFATAVL